MALIGYVTFPRNKPSLVERRKRLIGCNMNVHSLPVVILLRLLRFFGISIIYHPHTTFFFFPDSTSANSLILHVEMIKVFLII